PALGVGLDRHYRRGGERAEELDRHVSETTDADDHGDRVGTEVGNACSDGVIRGESGIVEGTDIRRIEVPEREDMSGRGNEHILCVAAVVTHAHPEPAS